MLIVGVRTSLGMSLVMPTWDFFMLQSGTREAWICPLCDEDYAKKENFNCITGDLTQCTYLY